MEKTHFCILLFLAFLTSLGNSDDYKELHERLVQLNKEERKIVEEREEIQQMLEDTLDDPYKYDDYNYDNKYDYDNQKPDDYTDDYSQKFIDDYYEHNLPNPPPLPSPPLPPPTPMSPFWECRNYKSLTDSTRNWHYLGNNSTSQRADWLGNFFNSFDWKGEAWYRVMGDAGTRIPEDPFTTGIYKAILPGFSGYCNTHCSGVLPYGSHPHTQGELVKNVQVCYNCNGNLCNYRNKAITGARVKIRHCGDYFVYYLTQHTNGFNSRYCTE